MEFLSRRAHHGSALAGVSVEIDAEKVPRLVNAKQFDAINYRRRVRTCIESARLEAGRPADGRRTGGYKYLGRHIHAQNRVRDERGTFVTTHEKEELTVSSICN